MANIQEVAKQAGVSIATVSRVLNNTSKVSEKTRFKVEKAIQELNYAPSMLGRNLRNSESRLLLVLIHTFSNPYYTEIITGIEDYAIENNYNILLCETDDNLQREDIFLNMVRNKLADGIISMNPTVHVDKLKELANSHSIVLCSDYYEDADIPYIAIDNTIAAYRAVKYLITMGNNKIGLINFNENLLYAKQRRIGFENALNEFQLPICDEWIHHSDGLTFQDGVEAMRRMLRSKNRPTAVFAISDTLAIGALKELHAQGIKVPQEMAIIGFDNIAFSSMTTPTLTTVSQPKYQMGYRSAKMVIDHIQGLTIENVIMDYELIIRESTLE
ncbi:LacI family DNA-binding transcriptional regulator [Oceanobacillus sp. CFH 90083]|uniref:LacI family DNA-binding transcriptional regulator n=1 Tax=Oceanobacillus sp. CFH 90083 TaxID=2592336 RepID=UPI00128DE3D0|nr:LacI family DNA-binding transcriptional regulator [Oceanobacillus sp. CFH 90083]